MKITDRLRVIRFIIAGGSAAMIEYVSFIALLSLLGESYAIVNQSVSFALGFITSFILNKQWVFRSTGSTKKEVSKYATLALINLGLSNVLFIFFTDGVGLEHWLVKLIIMGLIATWNYFIFQKIIFRSVQE